MSGCLTLIDWLKPHAGDPVERWGAARTYFADGASATVWILVGLGLLCLVGVGILVSVLRGVKQQAKRSQQFRARADALGLSEKEKQMLRALVRQSGLKQPAAIFTLAAAFDRGASRLLEAGPMAQTPEGRRSEASVLVEKIREKLGFRPAASQPKSAAAIVGPIPVNTLVHAFRPRYTDYLDARVTGSAAAWSELEVVTELLTRHEFGEEWEIRFSDGRVLWEMNASVTKHDGLRVFLKLAGTARSVNRRRFARAPTSRAAYVASFNFERAANEPDPPVFMPAALVEIAGPGLKLESLLDAGVDDKVLVGMQFGPGRVLQGQATVRRTEVSESGLVALAMEMMGLTTSEVAELARETNLAMTAHQTEFAKTAATASAAEG